MEGEKKRKRTGKAKGEAQGGERRRKEPEPVEAPSEGEVEEFFAILRRMQVAVKYFGKNGSKIDDLTIGNVTGDEPKVAALDSEVDGANKCVAKENSGALNLDLNAVPEAEEGA